MRSKNGVILTFGASDHLIEHNEIFEQMGDRIMAAVLCKKWLEMRKRHNNLALWSYTLHSLVSNTALAERGFLLGLDAFIIKNPGTTQVSTGMMSDAFEAIVGAVFMDAGDDGLKAVHDVLKHTGFFKDL
ncbi:hypothetical protein ACET3X_002202 [Alternaria dauci]|uniref:RNase III domain-containing protein n=1 Tax=Alternaria dauci TaxID=48095 RepID=A0ABR3UNV9_9PLEO